MPTGKAEGGVVNFDSDDEDETASSSGAFSVKGGQQRPVYHSSSEEEEGEGPRGGGKVPLVPKAKSKPPSRQLNSREKQLPEKSNSRVTSRPEENASKRVVEQRKPSSSAASNLPQRRRRYYSSSDDSEQGGNSIDFEKISGQNWANSRAIILSLQYSYFSCLNI